MQYAEQKHLIKDSSKNNIQLKAGKKYRVTFTVKATDSCKISAYTGQSVDPWSVYSNHNTISVGTDLDTFSYFFAMNVNSNAARIVFDLGQSTDNVAFKSVILEEIVLQGPSSSQIIKNIKSKISPTPVSNQLIISNLDDFEQVTVRNTNRQLLICENLIDFENRINTNKFASGTYFVSLQNQENRFITKIIKN